jgi:hypothetical protein
VEEIAGHDPQRRQAIHDAALEADRARLLEVAGRDADLADPSTHASGDHLGDELLVEHEVIAVEAIWDRLEEVTAVCPEAGVVFGQVQPERPVLEDREPAIGEELPAGHAPGERVAEEAAAQHQIAAAVDDRGDEFRYPRRVVLVIRVEHHHDISPGRKRRVIARLLVPAVTQVLAVDDHVKPELPGDVHGLVTRHVVDEDDPADDVVRDVGVSPFERPRSVIGGHDDDDLRERGPGVSAGGFHERRVASRADPYNSVRMHAHGPTSRRFALLGGVFLAAAAFAFALVRPIESASIGPDAAAPVIHFQHILAGHHLEGYLAETPKPLLTLIYGVLYSTTHDWRPIAWASIAAFAMCVALGGLLGHRIGGFASGAFVAVGFAASAALLADMAYAYAVCWALLAWLVACLALTTERPRYAIAGLALMLGTLARLETLIVVVVAAGSLAGAEIVARRSDRLPPDRRAYLVLLGFLAIPVMLLHDFLLTGDPFFWAKIAQLNSVGASGIRGPLQIALWLATHLAGEAPLLPLAVLGGVVLIRRRQWALVLGLLALGPGVAAFLVYLGARGIFVSARYADSIDLALLFTAGMGLVALDAPLVRRLLTRSFPVLRSRVVVPMVAGSIAGLAFAPFGLLNASVRNTILTEVRLHANEQRAMAAIRVELASPSACLTAARASGVPVRSMVIVPARLRVQAVVDLGLPLTEIDRMSGITRVAGVPAPGQIIYHDRLDAETGKAFTIFEIDHPVTLGAVRLVPLLADPKRSLWVIRVDQATCT